jgi:hypothetical protein
MRARFPVIPAVLASLAVALALAEQGGARSAESVACSSKLTAGKVNLTGTWTAADQSYVLWQKGSCLWWVGGKTNSNVFCGSVFGSTVTGIWADTSERNNGTLTLSFDSEGQRLIRRSSTGSRFPAQLWEKAEMRGPTT